MTKFQLFCYPLQECQSLIEENRRLLNLTNNHGLMPSAATANNVEAVILQSQVDTLQWQLKQVSCSHQQSVVCPID